MNGPEGSTTRLYEAKFRDAITAVLSAAIKPDRPVETTLAEALRRLFLCAPVHVIWRTKTELAAATAPDLRSPAEVVRDPARVAEILQLAEPLATARAHPRVTVSLSARDAPAFGMLLSPSADPAQLWIILEGPRAPLSSDLLNWFSQYSQGLVEFFSAVRSLMALKAVQRDAAFSALARRADAVMQGGDRGFAQSLDAGARVLQELVESTDSLDRTRVDLALHLAVWAAQALLGIGSLAGRTSDSTEQLKLEPFAELLERIAQRAEVELARRPAEAGRPSEVGRPAELAALAGILRATLPSGVVLPARVVASTAVDPALHLLVSWTRMHELSRRVAEQRRPPQEEDERSWNENAKAAIPDLAGLLEHRSFAFDGRATFVRNWARLWFCHLLLRASQTGEGWWQGGLLDDEKWRFRLDLSYALRESVRYLVYGGRDDYRFQPDALADALRTLVEQHALRVVGLPREVDVRTHLREIGDPAGPEGYHFAAGHLQHILEIYISGHFLCSLRVRPAPDATDEERALEGWSIAEVLASRSGWRPGAQITAELLKAFSLAALFHDTGMLLFPRYSGPTEPIVRGDSRLESSLGDVERAFRAAGTQLTERCIEDLRGADYLDTNADPGLARWLEDQVHSGTPDHALLGAWYLHRVSRALAGTPTEVLREALRAVLLHSLPALTIDVERDPVAALLVLCDELFEWEPFVRPGPAQQVPGRSIAVMAADVRARQSRSAHLTLPGLEVHARVGGEVDASLALGPQDLKAGWPRVELQLVSPERLEMAPHFIWLAMGQNLGRVERSRYGWGPSVTVTGAIPARLRTAGVNTQWLLAQIAVHSRHPARVSLERWVYDAGVFNLKQDERGGTERVLLAATNHVMHSEDIRRAFRALGADAERIIQERERKLRQP